VRLVGASCGWWPSPSPLAAPSPYSSRADDVAHQSMISSLYIKPFHGCLCFPACVLFAITCTIVRSRWCCFLTQLTLHHSAWDIYRWKPDMCQLQISWASFLLSPLQGLCIRPPCCNIQHISIKACEYFIPSGVLMKCMLLKCSLAAAWESVLVG
jgi:hypothetical protein